MYFEHFQEHYKERLSRMSDSSLVLYEDNLSQIISGELFRDCFLADEISVLYELIRDECVRRVAKGIKDK